MEQFDLEKIKRVIAERYNWGSSSEWTNFHFKELSKLIEQATGDRLSEETLKRIFGKRKVNSGNYQPQAFSQMVLMKFTNTFQPHITEKKSLPIKWRKRKSIIVYALIGLIVVIFFIFQLSKPEKYSFSCKNFIDFLPFTATFQYDIRAINDSVFCDFGNNSTRYLPPDNSMINYFYTEAGIYNVHFFTRSRMLDSLRVVVCSKDWQAGYFPNNEPEKFTPFINQEFYRQTNCFYAPPKELISEEKIDLKERYWTSYRYFSPFNRSLDSLTLETSVLNNASTGSYLCYDIGMTLLGDSGIIDFKFTQPKCSRFAKLIFSEKRLNGEFDDLNAMSVDLSDWLQIKMVTENNNFNLYLDNKPTFSGKYEKPLGNLLGIVYSFFGSGKIDYIKLENSNHHLFYENYFSSDLKK